MTIFPLLIDSDLAYTKEILMMLISLSFVDALNVIFFLSYSSLPSKKNSKKLHSNESDQNKLINNHTRLMYIDVLMFVHVIIFFFTRRIVLSLSVSASHFIFLRGFLQSTHAHNIIKRIRPMDKERKK